MKTVVAALIEKDGKYLIAQRKAGSALGGLWEFPGGKVEAGESDTEALEREIVEEFNTLIAVGKLLASTQINNKTILKLYACEHKLGAYQLREHSELAWVDNLQQLHGYELVPADVELLEQITKDKRSPALHDLVIGDAYKNEDIMRIFLVSGQGGMRKSNRANSLILFALHNAGNPYEDKWDDQGVMHYTGMGLSGDQSIDYAQNKTLAESRTNGVGVHLFESFEPKEYIYRGQVRLVGDPYYERQKDEANNQRQVVKFPLRLSQQ
jgi:mutator protein MutT